MKTKYDTVFFEKYALATLRDLYGDDAMMFYCSDKPDIKDDVNGFGIEVTRAMRENEEDAVAVSSEVILGVSSLSASDNADALVLSCFSKKLRLLRAGEYGTYPPGRCGLYVFSVFDISDEQAQNIMDGVLAMQFGSGPRYSVLFVNEIQVMRVFDLEKRMCRKIFYSEDHIRRFHNEASV